MCEQKKLMIPDPEVSPRMTDAPIASPAAAGVKPVSHWLKQLIACNPFYLASAVLLLFGLYRISVDPDFLHTETAQLAFNFTSLQFYEWLVVMTAIGLARRCIWYDATLLVVLENLLAVVPFILVSQAALIDLRTVWAMCLAAALLTAFRGGALWRWLAAMRFSPRLLGCWSGCAGGQRGLAGHLSNLARNQSRHQTHVGCRLRNERNKLAVAAAGFVRAGESAAPPA